MQVGWTMAEINRLRKMYGEGIKIKQIAAELGRTNESVNKAISRHVDKRGRKVNNSCQMYPIVKIAKHNVTIKSMRPIKNYVTLTTVVEYLKEFGHKITQSPEYGIFYFDNKTVTQLTLLLIANRKRIENKQPIFNLKDLI